MEKNMDNNIPIIEYQHKEEVFYYIYTGHSLEPEHNNSCINNPYMVSVYQLLPDYYQPHFAQLLQQLGLHEYIGHFAYEWDRYLIPNPDIHVYKQFFMMVTFLKLYIGAQIDIHNTDIVIQKMNDIFIRQRHHNEISQDINQTDYQLVSKNIYNIMYHHYQNFLALEE